MKSLTCALLLVLSCFARGEDMLADITSPVNTPFGVYHPRLVEIVPQAPFCDPGENLEHVVNLDQFHFSWSEAQLLKDNHFFVAPAIQQDQTGYNEMFDIYNDCRESRIPQFITTDAMLHGFHLMFDYILRSCEEERFIAQLNDLLEQLQTVSADQYDRATDERVRKAIFRNRDYLLVAAQLLSPKMFFADPLPGGKYNQELALIYDAQAQLLQSPIFNYPEDYTQYKPRGHYTKSDALQRYFRAMMWLGRMTFSCEDDSDYAIDMTLSAILLTQAIARVRIQDKDGLDAWDNIYQPTVFFVGKSDDIHFAHYLPLGHDIYGTSFPDYHPDTFADMDKLAKFLKETQQFPAAAIGYPGQPRKGFRFMGQRFVPDSWILDELVYDKIPFRLMPTGLDVMIVLGPRGAAIDERAFRYLSERDKNDQSYVTKLDSLKFVFRNYPTDTWAQNAYWNWLYCFMPLIMPKGAGYPFFMQTEAWRDKELYAALASWAELRHDTILYVKQSGTERGLPPTAVERQGYVEPNPHFYARIASLADFMRTGLASRDLLLRNFAAHIELYAELAAQLQNIAGKELTDSPLSSDDYLTIFEFGKRLYDIVTFQDEMPSEGPQPGSMEAIDPMPVIADVHYDSNSGTVLEEGVGYPYAIYVVCDIEGQPTVAKGAGFSYYEFMQPATDRLTDEQWRDMLKKATNPPPPEWTQSFCLNLAGPRSAEFYKWRKPATLAISHDHLQRWRKGDPLTFRFAVHDPSASDSPLVSIELADGRVLQLPVELDAEQGGWRLAAETASWPLGRTVIRISSGAGDDRLDYRTHFTLEKATDATKKTDCPEFFALRQNYPNPFNATTFIKFALPIETTVALDIYNIHGNKVRTLVASRQAPGEYIVRWDGADDDGKPLPSGICTYRLLTDAFADMKRLVLLR
ncbi:DUF3160 domain-containing protein [candidate division KSB1 bacterium]|nr:DUF3160 domain-containing protein [candidate division KSB1 bacterium]